MKRREILRYTALGTGTAVFAPLLSSILSGCGRKAAESEAVQELLVFAEAQHELVRDVMDTILPRTDTPSATDVGVDVTIDQVVGKVYSEADRADYKADISAFTLWLVDSGYMKKTGPEKLELLRGIEVSGEGISEVIRNGYLHLKQQVIAFYLSSEEIGENVLNYLPVPGSYEPCIKLEDVGGKAWSI